MMQFDPYLNWLGIPVHEQPPNFYRLLGLVLFESDPRVIEQAANRQSSRVGAYQGGPQGGLCQRVLSEIAMARYSLLDPQQKAVYDAQLQQMLAHRGECAVAAAPPPSFPTATRVPGSPSYGPPSRQPPLPPRIVPAPLPQPMLPVYGGTMPAPMAAPRTVPVATSFPLRRTQGDRPIFADPKIGTAPAPAAPPVVPPAAPLGPLEELERLTSQPSNRRRLAKQRSRANYSREITVGGLALAAAILLVVFYMVFQSENARKSGWDAFGPAGAPSGTSSPKTVGEKSKPESESRASTAPKSDGSARRQPDAPAVRRKPTAAEQNGRSDRATSPSPVARPSRQDIDSPRDLGGDNDPVMDTLRPGGLK